MRKKDLFNQNTALFEKLQKALVENRELKKEIDIKNSVVANMQNQLDSLTKKVEVLSKSQNVIFDMSDVPVDDTDENVAVNSANDISQEITLDEETEYGAKIIGKIVVESVKASEQVTDNSELKNLIMFKTESIKAEILSICSSDVSLEDKKSMIDFQLQEAIDYYRSILAQ